MVYFPACIPLSFIPLSDSIFLDSNDDAGERDRWYLFTVIEYIKKINETDKYKYKLLDPWTRSEKTLDF